MAEITSVKFESSVPVKMRDGTTLMCDVFRPDAPGKYPTLLERTPYDRTSPFARSLSVDSVRAALAGYAVVVQDCRGRFGSEGEFHPFVNEIDDGYDTIAWTAEQDWCDGNIGMFGGSYVGATQWLAAIARPPNLKAITPGITASNYHDGWTYQGGAFELDFNLSWSLIHLTGANYEHLEKHYDAPVGGGADLIARADDLMKEYVHLPMKDWPVLKGTGDFYYRWLDHPEYDDYWKAISIEEFHDKIDVPALSFGGWFDIFMGGTLRNYTRMREMGDGNRAREGQRLMIGPWVHPGALPGFPGITVGEEYFGIGSYSGSIDIHGILLRYFDHYLKGLDNGVAEDKPVKIFVMGENSWRDEAEWPLARAVNTRYYLSSGGSANSLNGDGVLSPAEPTGAASDTYTYDPMFPVPTKGGGLCCYDALGGAGAFDQTEVERREDVLVYTTPVLTEDTEVTGPITVTLFASSSAKDTDFTGKLVDVYPDGEKAINLTDGIIRARYRNGMEHGELITPGETLEYTIDLWATANVFKKGHRIRLDIASSNFPRFDRNPNTGDPIGEGGSTMKATQTIVHDADHPSHVMLPIVPR
jgi:putative CocE/NonD family hydrolase